MENNPKSEIYLCACHGEGVSIEKWDDNEIYMAFWRIGSYGKYPMSIGERLRWCWNILTKGRVWADEVILTEAVARQLAIYLLNLTQSEITSTTSGTFVTFTSDCNGTKTCWNCNNINDIKESLCKVCGEEI